MDNELKDILEEWKVAPEYVEKLEDQFMNTFDVVLLMTDKDIDSIFDKLGPRLMFKRCLESAKSKEKDQSSKDVIDIASSSRGRNSQSTDRSPVNPIQVEDSQNAVSTATGPSRVDENDNYSHVDDSRNSRSNPKENPTRKRPALSPVRESKLKKLCLSCLDGKVVLNYYKEHKKLNEDHRTLLANVIINDYLKDDVERKLPHETELAMAEAVTDLFPSESEDIWVASTSRQRNKSVGRGMLITRYYHHRRKAIKGGLLKKKTDKDGSANMAHRLEFQDEGVDGDLLEQEIYDEKELWLCNNKNPWFTVSTLWRETCEQRLRNLISGNITVNEYMHKYPAIRDKAGYLLLEADFEHLYEGKSMSLFAEWPSLSAFIESRALKTVLNEIQTCLTSDGKKIKTMQSLSCLFNVVTTAKKGRDKQWRPSRQEVGDSVLLHVKTVGDIIPTLACRLAEKYQPFGLHLAPQAIGVGPTIDSIEKCFVRVNETLYEVENPLKAIDIAFKIMHSLDCKYPKESEREWFFLETCIYGMNLTKRNPLRSKISAVEKDYNAFKTSI